MLVAILIYVRRKKQKRADGGCLGSSEATKDVISCDKLRGSAHTNLIRRFPNGATRHVEDMSHRSAVSETWGTETSKYP